MINTYSSLHNHSMYSLLDGYSTPEEYLKKASEIGLKAFAITEHGNEYSWCYFDKIKKNYPDIKMIYGVEMYECFDRSVCDKTSKYFHLLALAKNENGRKALNHLVTLSNLHGFYYKPRIELDDLKGFGDDLIISSACLASKIAREPDYQKCIEYINEYKKILPHFYLEMQSHKSEEQCRYNQKILKLSHDTNTLFIITTDSHAASSEDLYYQEQLVRIARDKDTLSEVYEGCYLQTAEEIHNIMDGQIGYDNVETGLANTNSIADMIEDVSMPFQSPQLPTFPLPDGFSDNYSYLTYLTEQGWIKRNIDRLSMDEQKIYRERLDYEKDIIHTMGFDGYFLIVWDFINWAKANGVKIGAGRGSCAGSLVCFLMGITDLNPIKYSLIFERFLNPERISMPDTDTDVSDRGKVIDYLISKYGSERVCQIINFSYITPIVAIKDVGKILGFPYKEMDKLSKRFTYATFQECLEHNAALVYDHPEYKQLFDIAGHLSDRVKTVSVHAGGVGIVDTDINDYMAMKLGKNGEQVIQVDKRIVEEIGIIKFDILGVQTLNLLAETQKDLGLSDYDIDINNPEFESNTTPYLLLSKARTDGVFQVESAGMKDLLIRLQASNLEDLSAVLALYRPDSMGALEEFIECKHDPSKVKYIHPDMKPILESTYGCMIYQEQLLDIVRKFGGRTYGGADLFRKAIGKKNVELVKQESAKLYQEIIDNGYSEEIASAISKELSTKGGYLFNKSHSYSYAVLCFQTAFLKQNYPLYFFKALLNLNIDKTGMINKYILDGREFNISVIQPNINRSTKNFSVYDDKILFGLSAISGIGEKLADTIINERNSNGDFKGFDDISGRINITKSQIVSLIKSGAIPTKNKKKCLITYLKSQFDNSPFEYKPVSSYKTKREMLEIWGIDVENYKVGRSIDKKAVLAELNKRREKRMKAEYYAKQNEKYQQYISDCTEKYLQNEQFWEFEALQIFLADNPFKQAYLYLRAFDEIPENEDCTIVGIIAKVQKKKSKNGQQFAFVNIYSSFGLVEAIVWNTQLKEYEDLIKKGSQIAMKCIKENETQVICDKIRPYNGWLRYAQRRLKNGD